jgi:hypothetical protein
MTDPFADLAHEAGLSHEELARFLNEPPQVLALWISGREPPTAAALSRLETLVARQDRTARKALAIIVSKRDDPALEDIGDWRLHGRS